jgi:nucleoside-diphosphate-sugar epimerase
MWLVTGSSGELGRGFLQYLRLRGIEYLSTSRKNSTNDELEFHKAADLSIPNYEWEKVFTKVTGIVHLAAAVPHSPEFPDNLNSAKLTATIDQNVINLQHQTKAPLIYISTCGLYSKIDPGFHVEEPTSSLVATSPYFQAKINGENLINSISNTIILRLSAPISPNFKENLAIGAMAASARHNQQINVYGNGTREQDFILVEDVCHAIYTTLINEKYGLYNLCSSSPVTMIELAQSLSVLFHPTRIVLGQLRDENEGKFARYSNLKLRETIDWAPETSITAMLKKMNL